MNRSTRDVLLTGAALVAVVFGLLTIASGGRVLFALVECRRNRLGLQRALVFRLHQRRCH
jgi:hypothetical protein